MDSSVLHASTSSDKSSEPFSIFMKFLRAHNLVSQLNEFPLSRKWVTTLPPLPNSARHRLEDPHGAPHDNDAQRTAIAGFLKIMISLLCSKGYPVSLDTHMPVNAAAMLTEQSNLIEDLQQAMAEQERGFREEMKVLCSNIRSEEQRHLTKTISDVESEMDRVVSSASKAVIGLEGSAAEWGQQQALLLEARQDAAKLKASILVLQTELSTAQRRIQELTEAQQESDDVIQSLELAFVAMQNVHRSQTEERDRDESRKGFQLDCAAAQLTTLVAAQSERLLSADEARMRLQRTHGEELLRVRLAHDAQVSRLRLQIDQLTTQKLALSTRVQELLRTQAELTGPHAKAMSTMLKNNMEMTERQYHPAVNTFRVTPEEIAARGPPLDFTAVLRPTKAPPTSAPVPPVATCSVVGGTRTMHKGAVVGNKTSSVIRPSSAPKASFLGASVKGYQCGAAGGSGGGAGLSLTITNSLGGAATSSSAMEPAKIPALPPSRPQSARPVSGGQRW